VFLNIIINALEAMNDGGNLWVGTAYHAERDQVVAAFRDSGTGITPEVREHFFEPFHTTKTNGTGLGLAISYGIVKRHKGIIEVESTPGEGATFIVCLPQCHKES
ncbi:MAG: ATP-binding protein, partial [Chloroflexota bacterium]|nr:ATP-binding protein [Chloroflexota bacterium]